MKENLDYVEEWQVNELVSDYSAFTKTQFLDDIERRLREFMLRSIKVCRTIPVNFEAQHFSHQLIRSSSSSAANFRAVRRSRSQKEFFSKLSVVIEELNESLFWLEILTFIGLIPEHRLVSLIDEGYQILKFLSKSRKTVSD